MSREYNTNNTLSPYVIRANEIWVNDLYGYKVIAVIYPNNIWCAYRGLTDWSDEFVQKHGDKLSKSAAEELFPTLAIDRTYNDQIPEKNQEQKCVA